MAAFSRTRACRKSSGTLLRNTDGAVAVEFALVAPILFFILFAIIEIGRGFFTLSTLRLAVEDSARTMAVSSVATCSSGADLVYTDAWRDTFETAIRARAGLAMSAAETSNIAVILTAPAAQPAGLGSDGCLIEIVANYPFSWILPGIPVLLGGAPRAGTQTMTASTRMVVPMT